MSLLLPCYSPWALHASPLDLCMCNICPLQSAQCNVKAEIQRQSPYLTHLFLMPQMFDFVASASIGFMRPELFSVSLRAWSSSGLSLLLFRVRASWMLRWLRKFVRAGTASSGCRWVSVRPPQAMVTTVIERVERFERRREMGYRVPKRFRCQVGCRSWRGERPST